MTQGARGYRRFKMEPFKVHVPDDAIEGLTTRLGTIRWPGRETAADDTQRVRLARPRGCWRSIG